MKTMIDTVKLLIAVNNPQIFDGSRFSPITIEQLVSSTKYGKTQLNPSVTYAKMGKYMPRLTFFKRPSRFGAAYQLAVEFSAPKLLFGNNFDELTDADFEAVLTKLQERLTELLGYQFFRQILSQAEIGAWHPSKNIVFLDYTSCQTVLNAISKLDVSRMYDLQKTNFRDGHVVHIHCNSLDIAMYDKMADLRKSKVSDKRAFEKNNIIQLNLLEQLEEYRPLEVFRYEVRLNGKAAVKRAFPNVEQRTFENLFKQNLSQALLLKHWQKLTSSVDMLSLDVRKPYELLQNYLIDNPDATPQAAMAAVTGLLISGQEGVVGLRNILDASYGRQAWPRIKKLLKAPTPNRFTHFQHIDEALEQFTPTKLSDFENNIANTVKL